MNLIKLLIVFLMIPCFLFAGNSGKPEEGMYPLSEIAKLDLKKAGLKIDMKDVYNPNGVSLIDALVRVGGCTGSFVSNEGLIITNHHCAFGAVQAASSLEHDYITNGFLAGSREKEIEAKGLTIRITESYTDVSAEILKAIGNSDNLEKRGSLISKKMKELVSDEEAKNKGIQAEVSEMFAGKNYVLFRYRIIRDVRLVYVPQRSIGEFGGESDNWVWPRHTGDFSFVRAYVAPDGSPAEYSEKNVPFKPKQFLKINPNGVDDGDFVFILGYPGRTFRNQPFQFVNYQYKYELPYFSEFYGWQIDEMEKAGSKNPEVAIKFAARIKTLANRTKNYRGKIQGLSRTSILSDKENEEKELQKYINSNSDLKSKYGSTLNEIEKVYSEQSGSANLILWYPQVFSASALSTIVSGSIVLNMAKTVSDFHRQLSLNDSERSNSFQEKNRKELDKSIESSYSDLDLETDRLFLKKLLTDAAKFPEGNRVNAVDEIIRGKDPVKAIEIFVDHLFESTQLKTHDGMKSLLSKSSSEMQNINDPIIEFAEKLMDQQSGILSKQKLWSGTLNKLSAELLEVKKQFKSTAFIPDANSTLRLTYGNVKGYSPADATWMSPITTLKGVIEKGTVSGDYELLPEIKNLYAKRDFGKFKSNKLNDVPVAILYNTDTSGGNSGSPVLNAYGELIAVNFDRAYGATINDYAWNEDYSRSIGVDIRYVLWIVQKVAKADFLLTELGIQK